MDKRTCYYANESYFNRAQQGYEIAKVVEDEAGWTPVFGLHRTLGEAEETVDQLNADLGLSRDDVLDIVASSMRAGRV
ncbi:hypothetical protein SEA_REINDEER_141 [Mycobacterium phage Reindeer]|uniref:Uncharacterized protein n=1 Tax=Mycobacterium phage Reindeer TaxID=2762283 RepID=A0A7G8LI60_9CAUD|nr:hypothetical protein J4U05_gp111 [Mycobacterium phage Reindeer]QNJ56932.1 hypothetical protein SEA_REINDEER_141 [Mycobacterium phage Reindeer]